MISVMLASVFGLPYEPTIFATTVVATVLVALAMLAVVFFAWAPHVSGSWATQFGMSTDTPDEEPAD